MNLYLYLYHFTNRSKRVFQKFLSSSVVLRYVFFLFSKCEEYKRNKGNNKKRNIFF